MKMFAVILIIAVLALGCVFAETTDKFKVKTTISKIYPNYSITGKNGTDSENVNSANASTVDADKKGTYEIEAIQNKNSTTGEVESVSINVFLNHFGYNENNSTKGKCAIRYTGDVTVTVAAGKLTNSVSTSGHVSTSGIPTLSNQKYDYITTDDFGAATGTPASVTDATAFGVTASYKTGKKVGDTNANTIASCTFTWDVTGLTAGDTYKADVVVTYTVQ